MSSCNVMEAMFIASITQDITIVQLRGNATSALPLKDYLLLLVRPVHYIPSIAVPRVGVNAFEGLGCTRDREIASDDWDIYDVLHQHIIPLLVEVNPFRRIELLGQVINEGVVCGI